MKLLWFPLIVSALVLNACDKKDESKKDDNWKEVSIDSLWFDFDSAEEKQIKLEEIPEADYQIVEISTTFEDSSEKSPYRTAVQHILTTAGDLDSEDTVNHASDFSKVDLEEYSLYPAVEINLPMALRSEGGKADFMNKYYYWSQITSDGGSKWRLSGGLSPKGDQFHSRFTAEDFKDGVYSTENRKMIVSLVGERLLISVENINGSEKERYRLAYQKAGLGTVHDLNTVKDSTDDGRTVTAKTRFEEMDSLSILPFVGLFKTDLMSDIDYLAITPNKDIIGLIDEDGELVQKYFGLRGSERMTLVLYDNGSLAGHMDGSMFDLERVAKSDVSQENAKLVIDLLEKSVLLQETVALDGFLVTLDFNSADSSDTQPFNSSQLGLVDALIADWSIIKYDQKEHEENYELWIANSVPEYKDVSIEKTIEISTMNADDEGDVLWANPRGINGVKSKMYRINVPSNPGMSGSEFMDLLKEAYGFTFPSQI